jgi:putative ABC transport system ATP-binding protein
MKPIPKTKALTAEGVSHEFGNGPTKTGVLSDVNLELLAGEFCLLMGESGSGKSTLLTILSSLLRPTQGEVRVLDTNPWTLSERGREDMRRQHFGFVFQGFHLFPSLTALAQLELVLRWGQKLSKQDAQRQSLDMLESLGLADKAGHRPHKLSGGEKQRVAIGRALVKRPTFCFADEPTSALDSQNANHVMEKLRETAQKVGSTVLVISHDENMTKYADRILRLKDGRLVDPSLENPGKQTIEVCP